MAVGMGKFIFRWVILSPLLVGSVRMTPKDEVSTFKKEIDLLNNNDLKIAEKASLKDSTLQDISSVDSKLANFVNRISSLDRIENENEKQIEVLKTDDEIKKVDVATKESNQKPVLQKLEKKPTDSVSKLVPPNKRDDDHDDVEKLEPEKSDNLEKLVPNSKNAIVDSSIDDSLRESFTPTLTLKKLTTKAGNPYAAAMGVDPNASAAASAPASAPASMPASMPGSVGYGSYGSMPYLPPIYPYPFGYGAAPPRYIGPPPQFSWSSDCTTAVMNVASGSGSGANGSGAEGGSGSGSGGGSGAGSMPDPNKLDPTCENLVSLVQNSNDYVSCEDYRYYSDQGWIDAHQNVPADGCYCVSKSEACFLEKPRVECPVDTDTGVLNADCLDEKVLNLGLGSFSKMSAKASDNDIYRTKKDDSVVSTGCLYLKSIQPSLPNYWACAGGSGSGSGSAPGSGSAAGGSG